MQKFQRQSAREDFRDARRQAALQQVLANLRGKSTKLLRFEEVSRDFGAGEASDAGLQEIPLEAIVGSVGRYEDFTRSFLPKNESNEERWIRVREQIERKGMSPIEVYRLGDAYFVKDGNHRVSVARKLGFPTIPAKVVDIAVRVPLSPDDDPDDLICKARYAKFLEETNLDLQRPGVDLLMKVPGHYKELMEQIEAQRLLLNLDPVGRPVTIQEAAVAWYDRAYKPLVKLIEKQGLQKHFPNLTETDLYILVLNHRKEMQQRLEWSVDLVAAATNLAQQKSTEPGQVVERMGERLRDAVTPDSLRAGPDTGAWRQDRLQKRPGDVLFADILVPQTKTELDQTVMRHAAIIARREKARILSLQVLKNETLFSADLEQVDREAFVDSCQRLSVRGEFAIEIGSVVRKIVDRLAWADLLVIGLSHWAPDRTPTGFGTHFHNILQRSPRPILVVPSSANSDLDRTLLAYDGSLKADEALFLAAYASRNWLTQLTVVSAGKEKAESALHRARGYLALRGVEAEYIRLDGDPASVMMEVAKSYDSNLIMMGGYSSNPLVQLVLGSTVNRVLKSFDLPVFICR